MGRAEPRECPGQIDYINQNQFDLAIFKNGVKSNIG